MQTAAEYRAFAARLRAAAPQNRGGATAYVLLALTYDAIAKRIERGVQPAETAGNDA
jgi:hypothetical protein